MGTSKQYLSAILAETEPASMRERIFDRLSLLLHATPARLFTPEADTPSAAENALLKGAHDFDASLTQAEQAVLADRHFLACEYGASYALVTRLLAQHGDALTPGATAQAELLAGKSACGLGDWQAAKQHLERAQAFWRKRLSAQPAKYLSLCLDTYRYLALAAHLAGDYSLALQCHERALGLYKKHPCAAGDLTAKWEAIALGALRTAARISLASLVKTADAVLAFCAEARLTELSQRVRYETDFCHYAISRATMQTGSLPKLPTHATDLWLAVCQGVALWERGDTTNLLAFAQGAELGLQSQEQRFVQAWLTQMAGPQASQKPLAAEDSSLTRGLLALALACHRAAGADAPGAFVAWQNALYELLLAREHPLYFLAYVGGLRQFAPAPDYQAALRADLARRVSAFTADAGLFSLTPPRA